MKSRHAHTDPRTPRIQGVTDLLRSPRRWGKPRRAAMSNLDAIRARPAHCGTASLGAHMLFSFQRPCALSSTARKPVEALKKPLDGEASETPRCAATYSPVRRIWPIVLKPPLQGNEPL